jgi:hypothetical protein
MLPRYKMGFIIFPNKTIPCTYSPVHSGHLLRFVHSEDTRLLLLFRAPYCTPSSGTRMKSPARCSTFNDILSDVQIYLKYPMFAQK